MSVHANDRARGSRWLWLAACTAACTGSPGMDLGLGTPTPEPPDNLPAPDAASVFNGAYQVTVGNNMPEHLSCSIHTGAHAVPANGTVWIVDLDAPASEPAQTVVADGEGRFSTELPIAALGDRVRLVSRTDEQHSLPLDGVCTTSAGNVVLQPPSSPTIDCLQVTPADATAGSDGQLVFTIDNQCSTDVTIRRAALRFGNAGFTLEAPASAVRAHGKLLLKVTSAPGTTQQGDILLLDLASVGVSARYALGVWSDPSSK